MKTEDIKKLLTLLSQSNNTSSDALTFVSNDLLNNKSLLTELSINFDESGEGIVINLAIQSILIYKTKADCIKYFQKNVDKDILIIQDKIFHNQSDTSTFFENLIYSQKIKKIIEEKEVISFHDKLAKKFILLSEKNGKMEVGYESKFLKFYDENNNLKKLYDFLQINLNSSEYIAFFRDNIIKSIEDKKEVDERFIQLLCKLENIIEKTDREYKLFLSKFSFDEFNSKLEEERDKYFKSLQDSLSDFLSKVNSLPIQFGVYIYLLFRFEKELYPLLIVSIIIIVWSLFSYFSISTMKKSIGNLAHRFENVFKKISEKSGIDLETLEKEKNGINDRLNNIKVLTSLYQIVVVVFTIGFLAMACFFIAQIFPEKVDSIKIGCEKLIPIICGK